MVMSQTSLPPDVSEDWGFSSRFVPEIKSILGRHLISEAPIEEDIERNTDFLVLTLKPVRVACRIRRNDYYRNYKDEFTLRSSRPGGVETEMDKIVSGWGDYFFYGFANEDETDLEDWFLGDLYVFRKWYNRALITNKGKPPGIYRENHDNSSAFRAYRKDQMPPGFFVAVKS